MKKVFFLTTFFAVTLLRLYAQPSVAASTPPVRNAADVVSLFSEAYANVPGTDWFPNWGQSTVVTDILVAGNPTKRYVTLNYQGVQLASPIDVSSMLKLHLDIWTPNCTAFDVFLINTSPSTVEQKVTLNPTLSGWNSFDISLSQYNLVALNNIAQLKLVGTPFGTSTVYLDNIYFWKEANTPTITGFSVPAKQVGDAPFTLTPPTSNSTGAFTYTSGNPAVATVSGDVVTVVGAGTSIITANQAAAGNFGPGSATATLVVTYPGPTTGAPEPPARSPNDVLSLFSGAYTNISGIDWFPNWGQSTVVTEVTIAGNATKKYDYLNYQGVQFSGPVDASSMSKLHLDIWTPNCSAFDVFLINTSPSTVEQKVTLSPTFSGWNSFDIDLTQYNSIALNNIGQLKLVGTPFGTSTVYLDNFYFWKNPNTPTITGFSIPAKVFGDAPFAITNPTSNSTGAFTYTSGNTAVATISGNIITIVGVGTSLITATQAPAGSFGQGTATTTFVVTSPDPSTAAPVPPVRNAADVVSLFSDAYNNVAGTDWFPNWGQSTTVTDILIAGNNTKKYTNLNYQGVQLAAPIDVSQMNKLHLDIWTPNCSAFDVFLINTSPTTVEQKVTLTPSFSGWNSFDINLSDYNTIALNNVSQLKLVGTPFGTSTVYLDNIYFYKSGITAAPTPPVRNASDVISLFSDSYSNIAGIDWFPNWGQSTVVSDTIIQGNNTKKYENLNYQGVQFAAPVDASSMSNLHVDIWTPNCTAFEIFLINTTPALVEQKVTLNPTLAGWNSYDIALTQYNTIALNNIGQIKLVGTPFGTSKVYLDNFYFWKSSNTPTITGFSVPAKQVGDAPFTLTPPTSNSTGAFTYTSGNPAVATISGDVVTIVGAGTSIITATQAPAGSFGPGSATATLVVTYPGPATAAPAPPARDAADVISLFSDAYANVPGTDWFPNWGQSTVVTEVQIAGNPTKKYEFLNYQGVQFASAINASAMSKLHVDIWTPNCTAFDVFLINTSPSTVEQKVTLTPTLAGWNSFDIDLAQYNTINLSNVGQIKLVGTPFGSSTVYLDNFYFWKAGGLPVTLVDFRAVRQGSTVSLNWSTTAEVNFRGFQVERSADAREWLPLNFVAASTVTATRKSYATTDRSPLNGVNHYRLKQIDLDGRVAYSPVLFVRFTTIKNGGFTCMPNPARGTVNVLFAEASSPGASLQLLRPDGILLRQYNVSGVQAGSNMMLDMGGLPRGVYLIRYVSEGKTTAQKIILE